MVTVVGTVVVTTVVFGRPGGDSDGDVCGGYEEMISVVVDAGRTAQEIGKEAAGRGGSGTRCR